MGCEITVELNSRLCHCRSAPSYTLFHLLRPSSSFSFHSTWQKESGIVDMQDCCHSAPMKPLQMEEDRKAFCFCCFFSSFFLSVFFFCHHIESLALELHIKLDHTIAFFAWGSCFVSICRWPLSDFTIRGSGGWGTSHVVCTATETWRTLRMNAEIACQGSLSLDTWKKGYRLRNM